MECQLPRPDGRAAPAPHPGAGCSILGCSEWSSRKGAFLLSGCCTGLGGKPCILPLCKEQQHCTANARTLSSPENCGYQEHPISLRHGLWVPAASQQPRAWSAGDAGLGAAPISVTVCRETTFNYFTLRND